MRRSPLLKLLLVNGLLGAGAAIGLVAGLVAFDAHGLRTLLASDHLPWVALILLTFGITITFSSVAMGAAIMLLPREEKPKSDNGLRAPVTELVPVRVAATVRR